MKCNECKIDITRRYQLTNSTVCTECKANQGDDFKWKMKTVGFMAEPTIAKTEAHWNSLKKQRKVTDI